MQASGKTLAEDLAERLGLMLKAAIQDVWEARDEASEMRRSWQQAEGALDEAAKEVGRHEAHIVELEAQLAEARRDVVIAAGECAVPIPEPSSDMSRLLIANVLLGRENATLRAERGRLIQRAVELVREVYQTHGAGGYGHIVWDDDNVEDDHVKWCADNMQGDPHGDVAQHGAEVYALQRAALELYLLLGEEERLRANREALRGDR